ncbi:MAG: sortase [Candidatus Berkelbacteria bacterium]|nr:sortase [Candidatus Berkelbacteria bacterium]
MISEKELEQLFIVSRRNKESKVRKFFQFLAFFVLIFSIIYFTLNWSALSKKLGFWYHDQFTGGIADIPPNSWSVADLSRTTPSEIKIELPNIANNSLSIPSINLGAPITFGVADNEKDILSSLKNGLIQLRGTAVPGEVGNIFITGHSSNFPWIKSDYNSVFALLDNVVIGDRILIKYQNQNYLYEIADKKIVPPSDTSVVNSHGDDSTLTLSTCTPVGTSLNRLIVLANQILPDPLTNTPFVAEKINQMPEGVR